MATLCSSNRLGRALQQLALAALVTLAVAPLPAAASSAAPTQTWVSQAPSPSPAGRYGGHAVYDPTTKRVFVFGGYCGTSFCADTWSWDGTTWTDLKPATLPPGRVYGAASLASADGGVIVLFGGYSTTGKYLNDTWLFDTATGTWRQATDTSDPPARVNAAMALDPAGEPLLVGGYANGYLDDAWMFHLLDASTGAGAWQSAPAPPMSVAAHTFTYDPARGVDVLAGGNVDDTTSNSSTDTFDGSTWTSTPSPELPDRAVAASTYDPRTGQVVLFGGTDTSQGGATTNTTYVWAGSGWTQDVTAATPPARETAQLASLEATGQVLLFGGYNGQTLGDQWQLGDQPTGGAATQPSSGDGNSSSGGSKSDPPAEPGVPSLRLSKSRVSAGQLVTVSGEAAGAYVRLVERTRDGHQLTLGSTRTRGDGRYTLRIRPKQSGRILALVSGGRSRAVTLTVTMRLVNVRLVHVADQLVVRGDVTPGGGRGGERISLFAVDHSGRELRLLASTRAGRTVRIHGQPFGVARFVLRTSVAPGIRLELRCPATGGDAAGHTVLLG